MRNDRKILIVVFLLGMAGEIGAATDLQPITMYLIDNTYSAIGITILLHSQLVMRSSQVRNSIQWNEEEINQMMAYFQAHSASASDTGTFKPHHYRTVAELIAPYRTSGRAKTAEHVRVKFRAVSK